GPAGYSIQSFFPVNDAARAGTAVDGYESITLAQPDREPVGIDGYQDGFGPSKVEIRKVDRNAPKDCFGGSDLEKDCSREQEREQNIAKQKTPCPRRRRSLPSHDGTRCHKK